MISQPWRFEYAYVKRIVDGDTLDLVIDLGFRVRVDVRVRLEGVDTPEIHGVRKDSEEYARGLEAKMFTSKWIDVRPGAFAVETRKTGKYGRWVAVVLAGDESLNAALIAAGYGSEG